MLLSSSLRSHMDVRPRPDDRPLSRLKASSKVTFSVHPSFIVEFLPPLPLSKFFCFSFWLYYAWCCIAMQVVRLLRSRCSTSIAYSFRGSHPSAFILSQPGTFFKKFAERWKALCSGYDGGIRMACDLTLCGG